MIKLSLLFLEFQGKALIRIICLSVMLSQMSPFIYMLIIENVDLLILTLYYKFCCTEKHDKTSFWYQETFPKIKPTKNACLPNVGVLLFLKNTLLENEETKLSCQPTFLKKKKRHMGHQ